MKRVIFMGRTGCGKTTLCQKLHELDVKYKKTQAIEIYDNAIDTPGEYMENRNFYRALIVTAVEANIIALVADPTVDDNFLPPAFAGTFAREVIGIVTKISLVDESKVKKAETTLREAGARRIFRIDTIEGVGTDELISYIYEKTDGKRGE